MPFMAIANSKLNDNENKPTVQDPGVTLLKLEQVNRPVHITDGKQDSCPYLLASLSIQCI